MSEMVDDLAAIISRQMIAAGAIHDFDAAANAREIIAVMRKPTREMLNAAPEPYRVERNVLATGDIHFHPLLGWSKEGHWHAMIDAALK